MRKRRLLWFDLFNAILTAVLLWFMLSLPPRDPLLIAFQKIDVGMQRGEAKDIIGRSPDAGGLELLGKLGKTEGDFWEWRGDESKLTLHFYNDRLWDKRYVSRRAGFLESVRRLFSPATQS